MALRPTAPEPYREAVFLLLDASVVGVLVHGFEEVIDELRALWLVWMDEKKKNRADGILATVILFERLALATFAQFRELVVRFVGRAEAEGVVEAFGPRRSLDGVEVVVEIGYRCVGVLARSRQDGEGEAGGRGTDVELGQGLDLGVALAFGGGLCSVVHGLDGASGIGGGGGRGGGERKKRGA